jgi:transcriptional regulator with XRE-family HTH domain
MSNGTSGRLDKVLAAATLAGEPSGAILRLERLALRIDQSALARQMGITRQRLDVLERRDRLTPEMIERYRSALRLIVTIAPADGRGATLANARDARGVDK